MDIRGIEVTNQLRSAIRAKLLELGVRYDEELPDYILVMVVNKKTRQQMHEDLHLFLEDSTTPFVEWLHDQVLKKLQKVTIAKKKTTREFVPSVIVKQEEERKKRKNSTNAVSEDQILSQGTGKVSTIVAKEEKPLQNLVEMTPPITADKNIPDISTEQPEVNVPLANSEVSQILPPREVVETPASKSLSPTAPISSKSSEMISKTKTTESNTKSMAKRPLEQFEETLDKPDKRIKAVSGGEDSVDPEEEEENGSRDEKRLKSCVNKPKVTSVVSVKNRLGILSPRKKFEVHRGRGGDLEGRHRQTDKRFEKNAFESLNRRTNLPHGKNFDDDNGFQRNRMNDSRNRQAIRTFDGKNRLTSTREERFNKNTETNDKTTGLASRPRTVEKSVVTVKDRLGLNKNLGVPKHSTVSNEEPSSRQVKNIKNRLGPVRNHLRVTNSRIGFVPMNRRSGDGDVSNIDAEDDQDDDQSVINVGPVKSHIIAVKRPEPIEKRTGKLMAKPGKESTQNIEEEEDVDGGKSIASKVIVTPRPLKPLQPTQKRATQSLLLRAVAEANQSVVKQKNPEPVLSDKKPKLKRLKPPGTREIGKNLSVHLHATKRLVMEKIQVQLSTGDTEDNDKTKSLFSDTQREVNDEHMGVVMSLFQRSDDNQKFLVTLNGYNNNVIKEKNLSDEEDERLEMEVTEDDELVLSNVQNDALEQNNESSPTSPQIVETDENETNDKAVVEENNENHNSENVETPEEQTPQRKRRKLSPIVYTRSRSISPSEHTSTLTVSQPAKESLDKRPVLEVPLSTVTDKTRDKCRYWPTCTLGPKCSYYHPAVPCSAFPACKFGDKCAYKHPKCKFGLSCTKLGCVFSHPKQQCKYHPFCTKPTCTYSHPPPQAAVPGDTTRAKFTWKRRD